MCQIYWLSCVWVISKALKAQVERLESILFKIGQNESNRFMCGNIYYWFGIILQNHDWSGWDIEDKSQSKKLYILFTVMTDTTSDFEKLQRSVQTEIQKFLSQM